MHRKALKVSVALALSALVTSGAHAQQYKSQWMYPLEQIDNKLSTSVVHVTAHFDSKPPYDGFGFVFADKEIMTSYGVIKGADAVTFTTPSGETRAVPGVFAFDADKDLAILYADTSGVPVGYTGNSSNVAFGDVTMLGGDPLVSHHAILSGTITGVRTNASGKRFDLSDGLTAEPAGRPMTEGYGTIIGITTEQVVNGVVTIVGTPEGYMEQLQKKVTNTYQPWENLPHDATTAPTSVPVAAPVTPTPSAPVVDVTPVPASPTHATSTSDRIAFLRSEIVKMTKESSQVATKSVSDHDLYYQYKVAGDSDASRRDSAISSAKLAQSRCEMDKQNLESSKAEIERYQAQHENTDTQLMFMKSEIADADRDNAELNRQVKTELDAASKLEHDDRLARMYADKYNDDVDTLDRIQKAIVAKQSEIDGLIPADIRDGYFNAIKAGDVTDINSYLQGGVVDVNTRDTEGDTGLIVASMYGQADSVNALISAGSDKNAHGSGGDTALIVAAYNGRVEVVRALINAGADLQAKNESGATAAFLADKPAPNVTAEDKSAVIALLSTATRK